MLGPRAETEPKIGIVYQLKTKMGSKPRPIYESKLKIDYIPDFLRAEIFE